MVPAPGQEESLRVDEIRGADDEDEAEDKHEYECPSCETVFTGEKYSPARRSACPICRSETPFKKVGESKKKGTPTADDLLESPDEN